MNIANNIEYMFCSEKTYQAICDCLFLLYILHVTYAHPSALYVDMINTAEIKLLIA